MMALQPIRHGVIKKFFQRFKYQRKKREYLLQLIEESEETTKEILGEDYVHFIEAIPEIKQFLQEVREKEITSGVELKKVSIEED
jgi:glycerol-3-phosphate O-acyltransferase